MKTNSAAGPTNIELYLRDVPAPEEYPLKDRIKDRWAGWADAKHLSTPQKDPNTEQISERILLTPWAVARRYEYHAAKEEEIVTHNGIVDPLRVEKTALQARIPRLKEASAEARKIADDTNAAAPADAAPRGPGEQYLEQGALISRRQGEKKTRVAGTSAAAKAALVAFEAALERLDVILDRLEQADAVLESRIARCRWITSRRITMYARSITRRHPDAPVVPALTEHLDLDENSPHRPGLTGSPNRLSIVNSKISTP